MAKYLSGVYNQDTDLNLTKEASVIPERVCGLLFDISGYTDFWKSGEAKDVEANLKGTVVELNSFKEFQKLGVTKKLAETDALLHGIAAYHVERVFSIGGNIKLFVALADCSKSWSSLIDMQKAADGNISNFGVWTSQILWGATGSDGKYALNLVGDINKVMVTMANEYHSPAVCILNANTSCFGTTSSLTKTIDLTKIPSCVADARYVTVSLGQENSKDVKNAQAAATNTAQVGNVGVAIGLLSNLSVHESAAWIERCPLGSYFEDVAFGFTTSSISSPGEYNSFSLTELEILEKGQYMYLTKHMGYAGQFFFNRDYTCSDTDYRLILLNRIINKSRRLVRKALLPYVNSPISVNPANGQLSTAAVTIIKNKVSDALNTMKNAKELEAFTVNVPITQNVLQSDEIKLSYSIIPTSTPKVFDVVEGLALRQ